VYVFCMKTISGRF